MTITSTQRAPRPPLILRLLRLMHDLRTLSVKLLANLHSTPTPPEIVRSIDRFPDCTATKVVPLLACDIQEWIPPTPGCQAGEYLQSNATSWLHVVSDIQLSRIQSCPRLVYLDSCRCLAQTMMMMTTTTTMMQLFIVSDKVLTRRRHW